MLERESASLVVYDEEFAAAARAGPARVDGLVEVLAWTDDPAPDRTTTVDGLIDAHLGQRPPSPTAPGRTVLLTSGTTGTPKGARRSGGGAPARSPRCSTGSRGGPSETTVVAAPMFHAWGFGQLAISRP